jgi:hypothetical protein
MSILNQSLERKGDEKQKRSNTCTLRFHPLKEKDKGKRKRELLKCREISPSDFYQYKQCEW